MDYLSLVLTSLRIRWIIHLCPRVGHKSTPGPEETSVFPLRIPKSPQILSFEYINEKSYHLHIYRPVRSAQKPWDIRKRYLTNGDCTCYLVFWCKKQLCELSLWKQNTISTVNMLMLFNDELKYIHQMKRSLLFIVLVWYCDHFVHDENPSDNLR
jgi:hypothetical protein